MTNIYVQIDKIHRALKFMLYKETDLTFPFLDVLARKTP